MKPLNPQEQLFIDAYRSNGRNGSKAAVTAGYSRKTARIQACNLLKRENIRTAIAEEDKKIVTSIKKSVKGSASWKRRKLVKIADQLSDVIDFKNAKAIIGAIAELNKMDGDYAPEKVLNANLNVDTDLQKVSEESRKAQEIISKYRSKY